MPGKAAETLRFAFRGIGFYLSAPNTWLLAAASAATAALAFHLRVSAVEWCLLILATSTVWVAEALNTALERLTDLVSPGYHPLAGRAKDIAAGAVLIAALLALAIGAVIFLPRLV
jgi:diacylglycerol kinase (ATP)